MGEVCCKPLWLHAHNVVVDMMALCGLMLRDVMNMVADVDVDVDSTSRTRHVLPGRV